MALSELHHHLLRSAIAAVQATPLLGANWHSRQGQALRHWLRMHLEPRAGFTFTRFFRSPAQLDALVGPVLGRLRPAGTAAPLRIIVLGCSTGAEPYTISAALLAARPELPVTVEAYDIDEGVLKKAAAASYEATEVERHPFLRDEHLTLLFDRDGERFTVKPAIRERVRFGIADVFDPALPARLGPVELLFAQNIFVNMRRGAAKAGFRNVVRLLGPRSALFVDGMDVDLRARLSGEAGLQPLDFALEAIHEEARDVRGSRYPWSATGLEPFDPTRPDRLRRYATIFLRGMR